jgi:hypothetical protein
MFILAGCSDIMTPPMNQQERNLKISVSSDALGSRTLYPNKTFSKYVLSFSGPAANGHPDITLEDGQTSAVIKAADLVLGELTITAKGYVLIDGVAQEAASGSDTITVTTGPLPSPVIYLEADMSGPNGFFAWSVSFPSSLVNSAELSIGPYYGGDWDYYTVHNNTPQTINLAPGYYLMSIRLYNDHGNQIATVTEIVHIYSNMKTEANYTFTENDFVPMVTLRGTINITINGESPDYAYLYVYDENNSQLGYTYFFGNTWSIKLAASDTAIPLYFRVEASMGGWFSKDIGNQGVTLTNQDKSNINLGTVSFNAITLSGTVNVTGEGTALSWARLELYRDPDYDDYVAQARINMEEGGTWSLAMEPFTADTTLYFKVYGYTDEENVYFSKGTGTSVTVKNEDKSGINLGTVLIKFITLSGTINVTWGGEPVSYVSISVYTSGTEKYFSFDNPEADTPWEMSILAFDAPTDIVFKVEGYNSLGSYFSGSVTVSGVLNSNKTNIDIVLDPLVGATPLIENTWVNGDISESYIVDWYSFNVTEETTYYLWWNDSWQGNDSQTLDVDVYAYYNNGSHIFDQDSAWSNPIEFTASSSGTVYFRVRAYGGNSDTGTYQIVYSTSDSRPTLP